jgi:hypothetical protein
MKERSPSFDVNKFVNPSQVGGIESLTLADGEGRGTRVLWVNTGGGLRFRVLVDRGLDIDQAFLNQHSLAFLTHKGATPPSRAMDRGIEWLKHFPGGLLTSCGPLNVGPPANDGPWELGLHGSHSNTAGTIESIVQPDPRRRETDMRIVGTVRYGQLFGPNLRLRRTLAVTLGSNDIRITDEFINDANAPVDLAWLLHINFGYPLIDEGSELCHAGVIEPRDDDASRAYFSEDDRRIISAPRAEHRGGGEAVAYVKPLKDRSRAMVGVVNRKLGIGAAIRFDAKQFPRCANWQHLGPGEYVAALEPMTGSLAGRDADRQSGDLVTLKPGEAKSLDYSIEALVGDEQLKVLSANTASRRPSSSTSHARRR